MKKKYLLIIPVLILIIILVVIFKRPKNEEYYILENDKIRSITNIVGERKITKNSKKKSNGIIIKTYKYKKVKDPYTDLSKYIMYLEDGSNFIPTKKYNLNNEKGNIELSRYSTDSEHIIIMDIKYNKNSYTIKITRGKGKITPLNKS